MSYYPYPSSNALTVSASGTSHDRREGVAADSTGSLSGASRSALQGVFSRRPEQDTLPFLSMSGHDLQVPPLARMFSSSSSLTLPQPIPFNTDGHHRQPPQNVPSAASGDEHHETRSEFRIILPPLLGLDCNPPPINPPYPDNDTYLRRQMGWEEDTPVNLDSLPDPPPGDKPPCTLPVLVKLAIQGSQKKKLTLEGIYRAVEDRFEYFRNEKSGSWKGSIRHNLSLNKVFRKTPRPITEAGRGDYWELDFSQGEGNKRERKRRKKGPSAEEKTETTARQLGAPTEESVLSFVRPKSPGQRENESTGPQRPVRHATSQSRFSPYPVGERSSRAPSLAWAHSTANDYAVNASRTEIGTMGYDGAWHAQQASSSTHYSVTPYPSDPSSTHFSGAVIPSPFVSGRGSEQRVSTAVTSSTNPQFGSERWVLPPLDVSGAGAGGSSRYHPFNEWELDEVQGVQLRHGRNWGDCQDSRR